MTASEIESEAIEAEQEQMTEKELNAIDSLARYKAYKEYNSDVIGLIQIRNSVLNHPICQTPEEEDFYLRRDLDKKSNSHGVPFATALSDLSRTSGNNILYGHNISKGTRDVFADLAYYEDLNFYKFHPIVEITTGAGTDYYLVFAYYLVDTDDDDAFAYWEQGEWDKAYFEGYMAQVMERNWLDVPIELSDNDVYLTLSSCSKELAGSGTNRMVVMAKKLDKDFDYTSIVERAKMRENPLLPQKLRKK